jgi:hypothetical protein
VATTAPDSVATRTSDRASREGRWRWSPSPVDGLFAVGLGVLLAYAAWLGRDLWFFSDDWDIIAFHHNGAYLTPYNGHLWLIPIGIFHTLYVTAGLGSYAPYRAVGLVGYALLGIVFYVYCRQRVAPVVAALAALSVMWFSTAQYNLLFPLLVNFSLPLACTAGIWLLLDRETRRADIAGGVLLAVALATNSVGLVTVVVVATELLWRRAPLRRWLPFIPPLALWLVWYAKYHTPMAGPGSAGAVIRYALHEIQATFAGFAGGSNAVGYVLLIATAIVFVLSIVHWHTFNARAAAALAGLGAFALLTAYTRQGFVPPVVATTPRYLWLNSFFVVAALIEVIRRVAAVRTIATIGTIIVVVGAVTLVGNLRSYHAQVVTGAHTTRSYLTAVEAIPNRINRRRLLPVSYIPVSVGAYLTAVRHLGSPIDTVSASELGTEADRAGADEWMITDLGLGFEPAGAARTAACTTIEPVVARDGFEVHGPSTIVVQSGTAPVAWTIRRLASVGAPQNPIPPGNLEALHIPHDHSSRPWHVQIAGPAAVSLCR